MKKIHFTCLIFIITTRIFAQNFPENRYQNRVKYEYNNQVNGFAIGFSSSNSVFLNETFGLNVESEVLRPKFGMNTKIQYAIKPLIFDINYFSSNFKPSETNKSIIDGVPIDSLIYRHRGIDVYISLKIIPSNKYLFKNVLLPYVGIGYQFSELALTKDSFFQKSISGVRLNNPMWKVGLATTFSPVLVFYGEYKRTNDLFVDKKDRFYQFNFGILVKLSFNNKNY